jgi:hypothetical protein
MFLIFGLAVSPLRGFSFAFGGDMQASRDSFQLSLVF